MNAHGSIIPNNQKAETTQMSIHRHGVHKMWYIPTTEYFSLKKEGKSDTRYNMDEDITLSEIGPSQGPMSYDSTG